MNVLSLFDGKSSGYTALEMIGITPTNYYSSEIDKYAIQVSDAIHPNQVRLGDVTKWREWDIDWGSIDLILGGFPCQAWSMAGKQLGDKDERGMLFWVMLDIMKEVRKHNPKAHFLIENVKMKKEFEEYITHHTEQALGEVHKILINSALVSAQNRNRYYWTSWETEQPEDRGIVLADIIESDPEFPVLMSEKFCNRNAHILRDDITGEAKTLSAMEYVKNGRQGDYVNVKCCALRGRYIVNGKRADHAVDSMAGKTEQRLEIRSDEKTNTLTTVQKDNQVVYLPDSNYSERSKRQIIKNSKHPHQKSVAVCTNSNMTGSGVNVLTTDNLHYRKLTPRECFRLQTVPEHYIDKILNSGELYRHFQYFYNRLTQSNDEGGKCKSVKSMTVSNQLQAEKLNYAINTTLDSLDTELLRKLGRLSIKADYAQKVGASVIVKLQKVYASSTTRHGSEKTINQPESVRFVLKTSEVDGVECVLGTLNQSKNMETQIRLTLTPEENSSLMGIKVSNISKIQTVDGLIELLRKRLSEESCEEVKWYTTLMATNLIIAKAIFLFANLEHNTYLCIDSLSQSHCNSLEVGISTLKMENIKPTSNSALYKIAGNGWTDEVIAHLLMSMPK